MRTRTTPLRTKSRSSAHLRSLTWNVCLPAADINSWHAVDTPPRPLHFLNTSPRKMLHLLICAFVPLAAAQYSNTQTGSQSSYSEPGYLPDYQGDQYTNPQRIAETQALNKPFFDTLGYKPPAPPPSLASGQVPQTSGGYAPSYAGQNPQIGGGYAPTSTYTGAGFNPSIPYSGVSSSSPFQGGSNYGSNVGGGAMPYGGQQAQATGNFGIGAMPYSSTQAPFVGGFGGAMPFGGQQQAPPNGGYGGGAAQYGNQQSMPNGSYGGGATSYGSDQYQSSVPIGGRAARTNRS
ncbi:hypothetical protein ANCCAN_02196 [Ancylostoma caninum]|uniref:Uncharacterized protein n=1 Tax=Ancylostoma caninum TaxID=29170 RepID=A0A368H853_ANCCA|nr:hypothetical protein ANCCAN_02196 [Ancylostoma caninum]